MLLETEIVDYAENKNDIQHWVKLKGEFRYEKIIDFLKSKDIECTWGNVTNYIRYDKRILINSFKYIVFLEEFYKSLICEYKKVEQNNLIIYDFKKSLKEYLSLGNKANYDGIDLEMLKTSKKAVVDFRNTIAHNKILLGHIFIDKSLEEILDTFIKILPASYRQGFITDINDCARDLIGNYWKIVLSI